MTTHHRRLLRVAAATITTDLASKAAAARWLNDPLDLGIITVRATKNSGIAFGIGANQPYTVVAALPGMVVAAIAVTAWRGHLGGPVGAGLLVGGGTANLANRIVNGSVVDLLDLGWWPVFNLADVALTVGIALTMITAWREGSATNAGQPTETEYA